MQRTHTLKITWGVYWVSGVACLVGDFALKLSIFVAQRLALHQNGVEFILGT